MSAKKARIGSLRDLRKDAELGWLKPKDYIIFEQSWLKIEDTMARADKVLMEEFNMTGHQFLDESYPNEPLGNFNPNNRLGLPRHKWEDSEYQKWQGIKGKVKRY